ncbi:MAG: LysR substrate-binding domain-containing protein [Pseudomonadota bacterium]
MRPGSPRSACLPYRRAGARATTVHLRPVLGADVTLAVKALCPANAGVAILPEYLVSDDVERGDLVRLLPDWRLPSGGVYSVFPPTAFRSEATRRFAELFATRLQARF